MENKLISSCPRCNENLIATKLACGNCKLELNGNFQLSKFDYLTADEMDFVLCFLKSQGNLKSVQNLMEMSYPAVKKKMSAILGKLDLEEEQTEESVEEPAIKNLEEIHGESRVIKIIREKLNRENGQTKIKLYNGDLCDIRFDDNKKGLRSSKIPVADKLVWEVFDAAVEVAMENGGKAKKGNAQSGAKLGSDKLPLDSVEGYIASKVYGVEEGGTSFGPGFVIYSVLEWAGICKNGRGYIEVEPGVIMGDEGENVMKDYKFHKLSDYFSNEKKNRVRLTYEEIEKILGFELCKSAYEYKPYWNPSKTHTVTKAWLENGWDIEHIELGEYVEFYRC